MNKIIPNKLKKGDKIGVISPSAPITKNLINKFEIGLKFLKNLGFKIVISKNALSNTLKYSATPQEKADDINEMFENKTIKAIICSQGGENSNSVLPFLDYKTIKLNPKIFFGISDATIFLNALYSKTGLVTFHSNDIIWGFSKKSDYEKQEFIQRLLEGKIGKINKNSNWKCIRKGCVEGILLGGNLFTLTKLIGTKYFPDFKNKILFLEDFGEEGEPHQISSFFHHLDQVGVFKQIKGLWLGYYKTKSKIEIEDIAKEITQKYNFPILKCDDFGHNTENTVIPIGVKIKLDATNKNVEILEKCVK